MTGVRLTIVVFFSLALSACVFESKTRLIEASNAVFPFNTLIIKGQKQDEIMVVIRTSDGYYAHSTEDKGAKVNSQGPILIAGVKDFYIAQLPTENEEYRFVFFKLIDDKFSLWGCSEYDKDDLKKIGISECKVASIEDLKKVANIPLPQSTNSKPLDVIYRN